MNLKENTTLMKNQTFGVEIEMSKISKEKTAQLVQKYFNEKYSLSFNSWYDGSHHRNYCAQDKNGRIWNFMDDGSGSGRLGHIECELVTPILTYDDIEDLQCIVRLLRENGAKSGANYNAGVHIHIGANINDDGGQTAKSIRNLVNVMASHEKLLLKCVGVSDIRLGWCKLVDKDFLTALNRQKPTTTQQLGRLWYGDDYSMNHPSHYDDTRYHMLNLHAIWDKGTIEFRLFEFKNGLHAGELKSWIQLCMALCNYAKMVDYATPRSINLNNEKYAMKNWLVNMGFVGEEFKTARKLLTRRLSGDTAYRNGRTHISVINDLDDLQLDTQFNEE